MTRFLTITLTAFFALGAQAYACNCGGGAKQSVLKDVTSRESSIITSREGIPLKAQFWGATDEETAAPVAAATKKQAPAPVTASSDTETVESFRLEFAPNAKTPNEASLEQVPEIKKALASGNYKSVRIVGFADQTGTVAYNNKLSLTRAQEVEKMIKGAAPRKTALTTIGAGVKDTANLDSARIVEVQFVR